MKTRIQIKISCLFVVLKKGCEKEFIGKGYVDFRSDKPKLGCIPWFWKSNVVVIQIGAQTDIRLKPVTQFTSDIGSISAGIIAA